MEPKTREELTLARLSPSQPASQCIVVQCNCPNESVARDLAQLILQKRLAACVNSMPVTSSYRWENELRCEQEVTLTIKTTNQCYPQFETVLTNAHPFEVPEIIALPITAGLPSYLQWISDETSDLSSTKQTPNQATADQQADKPTTGAAE